MGQPLKYFCFLFPHHIQQKSVICLTMLVGGFFACKGRNYLNVNKVNFLKNVIYNVKKNTQTNSADPDQMAILSGLQCLLLTNIL